MFHVQTYISLFLSTSRFDRDLIARFNFLELVRVSDGPAGCRVCELTPINQRILIERGTPLILNVDSADSTFAVELVGQIAISQARRRKSIGDNRGGLALTETR